MMSNQAQISPNARSDAIAERLETLPLDRFEKKQALACLELGERLAGMLMSSAHAARSGYAALVTGASRVARSH